MTNAIIDRVIDLDQLRPVRQLDRPVGRPAEKEDTKASLRERHRSTASPFEVASGIECSS